MYTKNKKLPHIKRCETCKHKRIIHEHPNINYEDYDFTSWMNPYIRCLIDDEILTRDMYKKICAVGCASHDYEDNINDK